MTNQQSALAMPQHSTRGSRQQLPTANTLALAGTGFGLLANVLLRDGAPAGIGFSLWLLLLGTTVLWFIRQHAFRQKLYTASYAAIAVLASVFMVARDTDWVTAGLLLVILFCAAMTYLVLSSTQLLQTSISEQLINILRVPYQAVMGFLPYVPKLQLYSGPNNKRLSGILRGLILVSPVLVVFSLLFASADIIVDRFVTEVTMGLSTNLVQYLFITFLFGWIAAGLLAGLVGDSKGLTTTGAAYGSGAAARFPLKLGEEEVITILGLVTLMFVAFVALQATYLFGGQDLIQRTTGLTLAEYARRGFFELMWVAALSLVLLLLVRAACPASRYFKPLAVVMVACVMIMLISASQRLGIYIDEFGLSVDRIVAAAVMCWLAFSLILFALLTLKGVITGLAMGISHSGMMTVFALAIMNPAAYASAVNINRAIAQNTPLDLHYIFWLGADAVPAVMAHVDELSSPDICEFGTDMLMRWGSESDVQERLRLDDWRSWNFGRAQAVASVQAHQEQLQTLIADCDVLESMLR